MSDDEEMFCVYMAFLTKTKEASIDIVIKYLKMCESHVDTMKATASCSKLFFKYVQEHYVRQLARANNVVLPLKEVTRVEVDYDSLGSQEKDSFSISDRYVSGKSPNEHSDQYDKYTTTDKFDKSNHYGYQNSLPNFCPYEIIKHEQSMESREPYGLTVDDPLIVHPGQEQGPMHLLGPISKKLSEVKCGHVKLVKSNGGINIAPPISSMAEGTAQSLRHLPIMPTVRKINGQPTSRSEHSEEANVRDAGATCVYSQMRIKIHQATSNQPVTLIGIGAKISKDIRFIVSVLTERNCQAQKAVVHYVPFRGCHHDTANYD